MDNLPVGSAHCAQAVIVSEKLCEFRIDLGLILAFMFDDLSRNDCVCLRNQCDCSNSLGIIQRIGNFPQPVEPGFNPFVILAQGCCGRRRHCLTTEFVARRQRSQGIEYHGYIDRFLRQRSGNGGQPTDGSKEHRHPRHRHSGNDALHGNAVGALGDGNGIRDAIESIDENDDICRLRRGAGAPEPP